jgi:hypothetical protein
LRLRAQHDSPTASCAETPNRKSPSRVHSNIFQIEEFD